MTSGNIALILIDVQKSFLYGSWRNCFMDEVTRIEAAFKKCSSVLQELPSSVPVLCTRCPFRNPQDFQFYEGVEKIIKDRNYPCVIKPNTNIMHAEGIQTWMKDMASKNVKNIVIGGCTMTSCVRVSSINLKRSYRDTGIQFIVDLSMTGARDQNYHKMCKMCIEKYLSGYSDYFCRKCEEEPGEKESPVDRACSDMIKHGVEVIETFDWTAHLKDNVVIE